MTRFVFLLFAVPLIGLGQQVTIDSKPAWLKLNQFALRSDHAASAPGEPRPTLFIAGDNVFSQLATGGGWATTIFLTNLGNTRQSGDLDFWTPTGGLWSFPGRTGRGDRFSVTLEPGATAIIESDDTGQLQQGWASLTRNTPEGTNLVGAAVFRQRVAGRPDFEASVPLTSYFDRRVVLLFDNTSGFVTAAAMVNSSQSALSLTCTVRDSGGRTLESVLVPVPSFGQAVFTFPDRFPQSRNLRGSVLCSAPSDDLSALVLRFNPGGAFSYFPIMVNLTMRQ
jgi:hypothetical protein